MRAENVGGTARREGNDDVQRLARPLLLGEDQCRVKEWRGQGQDEYCIDEPFLCSLRELMRYEPLPF